MGVSPAIYDLYRIYRADYVGQSDENLQFSGDCPNNWPIYVQTLRQGRISFRIYTGGVLTRSHICSAVDAFMELGTASQLLLLPYDAHTPLWQILYMPDSFRQRLSC
jgi:hypothetical protein